MTNQYSGLGREVRQPAGWQQVARTLLCGVGGALALAATALAQSHSDYDAARAQALTVTDVAFGLRYPQAVAFLPDGDYLVAERRGAIRVVRANGRVEPPLQGMPEVSSVGQGGLLDVVTDRNFASNRRLYFCFAQPESASGNRSATALAAATLPASEDRLSNVRVIFRQMPSMRSTQHYGCRIAQADDGSLFLAMGDRGIAPEQAQRATNNLGSVVRLLPDGRPHPDNPFARRPGGRLETWSWGHRNIQGAVVAPDGRLWTHEHGPRGGDELNLTQAGHNYGWPLISRGHSADPGTGRPGLEQPVHYWPEAIGPSGMAYLDSGRYGSPWQGSFFIGSLLHGSINRLKIRDGEVVENEWYRVGPRVRDVREGQDGLLYVLLGGADGRLLRIEPPALPGGSAEPVAEPAGGLLRPGGSALPERKDAAPAMGGQGTADGSALPVPAPAAAQVPAPAP